MLSNNTDFGLDMMNSSSIINNSLNSLPYLNNVQQPNDDEQILFQQFAFINDLAWHIQEQINPGHNLNFDNYNTVNRIYTDFNNSYNYNNNNSNRNINNHKKNNKRKLE